MAGMTEEDRKSEFNALFDSMPGVNAEKIRQIASFLCCEPNTVRIWRMKSPTRVIPEGKLRMLQREFGAARAAQ